jgi:mannosyltransferase OCH1-like enzyme
MRIRLTERIRCVIKHPNYSIHAKTHAEFKAIVESLYPDFGLVFTKMKARVEPFSLTRIKLTWKPIL